MKDVSQFKCSGLAYTTSSTNEIMLDDHLFFFLYLQVILLHIYFGLNFMFIM